MRKAYKILVGRPSEEERCERISGFIWLRIGPVVAFENAVMNLQML